MSARAKHDGSSMKRNVLAAHQGPAAIYIDFECLMGRPHPKPKLLGILIDGEVEQVILDEALAPARAANRRCRVASIQAAIRELVERAEREERVVAGWSFFDRDVAERACPDLAGRIRQRYRNAIQTARPWRQYIHPSVRIQADEDFAPRHTLDKYAALVGYPQARAMVNAKPATWLRETAKRLEKSGGRYGALSKAGKRDWHRLLEYNRHDCLALRDIAVRAARELEAWRAYERTRYCVDEDARRVCFSVGSRSPRLEALLARHRARRFAFITAWNPGSVPLAAAENDARQRRLRADLESLALRALPGEGVGDDPSWTPEGSLMVLNVSEGRAVALGRKFGQLAIVVGKRGEPPRLVSCAVPGAR